MADSIVQWAFTLVFLSLAGHSAYRIPLDRARPAQAVGHVMHVAMAVDMAAMAWPWWVMVPAVPQIVFFTVATAWFGGLLVLQVARRVPRRSLGGHGPGHQLAHVVMMLAMVWMVTVMTPVGQSSSGSGHGHSALTGWAALSGVAVTAALLVAGVILLVEFLECVRRVRRTRREHTGSVASGAVMSLGMAAMCWPMLA